MAPGKIRCILPNGLRLRVFLKNIRKATMLKLLINLSNIYSVMGSGSLSIKPYAKENYEQLRAS
jgi:hypothetical protein